MRFLHTGDWHIGKPLRNQRRDSEYQDVLAEVLDIARMERVDCLLVAGDIFDSAVPPPEAERIVFDFFRELVGAGVPAVIIGGNHDHPRRLNAFSQVLDLVRIHVRGEPVLADEGGVVELASRDGQETAVIAALPWVSERKVRTWEVLQQSGDSFLEYAAGVSAMIEYLCRSFRPDSISILLAHLMLDGAFVGPDGGERPLHLGQTYAIRPQALPVSAQYVGLGHLHRGQEIRPAPPVRYAGSLLQLDFGEAGQQKSVTIVEASPGLPAHAREVPLTKGRRLHSIGSRDAGVALAEIRALADNPEYGDGFLRVYVSLDGPVPALADQVREFLPNAVDIIPELTNAPAQQEQRDLMTLSPEDLFLAFCRERRGGEPAPELMQLFHRLYQEATSEAD
ncbi:MAG TPA: exonuclease SbcCD subunit D [Dehalococcoidia bacterium]|nr:exonuclease SbcCD subunit D [Dehalococcoidia bacterium]